MGPDEPLKQWDELGRPVIPRRSTPFPPDHNHLNEDELWALAGYDGGPIAEAERSGWHRALDCSECYNRLARLRYILQHPEAYEIPIHSISVEELRRAQQEQVLQAPRIQISLEWLAVMLAAAAKTRIRIRGPARIRSESEPRPVPGPAEAPLARDIAGFVVTITAVSEPQQRCKLIVHAEPKTTASSTEAVVARLHKPDKTFTDKHFQGKIEVCFTGLELDLYELELVLTA